MPLLEMAPALDELPPNLRTPLLACGRGEMPANIALMHLCMAAPDRDTVDRAIATAAGAHTGPALTELAALWRKTPRAFELVKRVIETVDHDHAAADPDAQLADYAAAFDRAAGLSPEASVALYSLGSPDLLAAATAEIVQKLREWGLLGAEKTALEIGCGNGRFLQALAPGLGHITGIDISAAMIAAARERCRDLPNAEARQTQGRDLAFAAGGQFDAVLAIDSFPYIVRCGSALVRRHFEEAARVLKPGGHLLILNYAYDGSLDDQRAALRAHASATGFSIIRNGSQDFRLWDGRTFLLRKGGA